MKIERFEDILAWQEARKLTNEIYKLTKEEKLEKDFRLKGQLQAASVSIMSNIAEGFARKTNKEFIQFLFIAKGSSAEVQSLLYVLLDQNYIKEEFFSGIYGLLDKISRMLSNLIKYLKMH